MVEHELNSFRTDKASPDCTTAATEEGNLAYERPADRFDRRKGGMSSPCSVLRPPARRD